MGVNKMNSIKKFTVVLVSILAVTMTVGVFTSQPVQARATVVFINPGGPCGIIDVTGTLVELHNVRVVTESNKDNRNVSCHGTIVSPFGKTVIYDALNNPFPEISPLNCEMFGKLTTDWKEVISPSGRVTMVCHFKS